MNHSFDSFISICFVLAVTIGLTSCKKNSSGDKEKIPSPEFESIISSDSVVKQFELLEINIELSAVYDNAFDPEEIELTATFISPSGKTDVIDGFYYQDFIRDYIDNKEVLKEKGDSYWKIRYSPKETGVYSYYLHVKNYKKTTSSSTFSFTCTTSQSKGFIRKSVSNNVFLEFDNKSTYIPVGMSVAWVDQKNGTYDYDSYFKKLNENQCNYSRIWLVEWNLPIEWTNVPEVKGIVHGLGRYSLDNSWRLDYILEQAKEKNLYLLITLGTYGELMKENGKWNENKWKNNPYNYQNGGMCKEPADFWSNSLATKYYRNRLRYIISRWGYSTNIMAFELWNEVDAPADWINEQASYIKQKDVSKHLVTTSIGYPFDQPNDEIVESIWKLENIDFTQTHLYGRGDIIHIDKAINQQSVSNFLKYKKPHFVSEFGIDFYNDDKNYDVKGSGSQLHCAMWSGLTSLSIGTAITHWKEYVDQFNLYHEFNAIANFTKDLTFEEGNWKTLQVIQKKYLSSDSTKTTFSANAEWGNSPKGFVVLKKNTNPKINKFIHAKRYSDKSYYYTPVFKMNMEMDGEFQIHVNEVAENAKLIVYIDNQMVWEHEFNSSDRLLKKTYVNEKYNIKMLVYDREFCIPINSGNHEIRIENTGSDWLSIKKYSVVIYNERYLVQGITNNKIIIGWMNNLENNWKYINSSGNPRTLKNISFMIAEVPNSTYKIDWFDPVTGVFTNTEKIVCNNGFLTLKTPELQKDKAFIIRPIL